MCHIHLCTPIKTTSGTSAQLFCYYGNSVACHSSTSFACEQYVLALFCSPLPSSPPLSLLFPSPLPPASVSHPLPWDKAKVLLHCSMVCASTVKHRCVGAHFSTTSVLAFPYTTQGTFEAGQHHEMALLWRGVGMNTCQEY